MKITPLFDRVVLKQIKEQREKTNIILPDTAQAKPILAKVMEIGTGGKLNGEEIDFKVKGGDNVLYNKYAGNEFNIDGEEFILIKQSDILAIIE